MIDNKKAKELLDKRANGTCTEEENALLETWYMELVPAEITASTNEIENAKEAIWQQLPIHHEASKTIKLNQRGIVKWIAAAVILVATMFGYDQYTSSTTKNAAIVASTQQIIPGSNKAILKLADGEVIDLAAAKNGLISNLAGLSVTKIGDGQIVYAPSNPDSKEIRWNIIEIPVAGFYSLTLSDGTIVWLNSKSSLKYPTSFASGDRVVELKGEGYFEVAHRDKQPFKVLCNNQIVEVLGTHFNINSYEDEDAIVTTLLEGKVKVRHNEQTKVLTPGYRSVLSKTNFKMEACDAENAVDWVNNDFVFRNEQLGSIMRKIARWYNVEVAYGSDLEGLTFSGSISRTKNIDQVLKIMELTQLLNFKIEGRRVIVTN